MSGCPTDLELERFLAGDCPGEERERLERHRRDCETCAAWLREALADEEQLTELRRAHTTSSATSDFTLPGLEDEPALARYHILRRIARGGMGVVYEAEQRNPRRSVALKVLAASFVSERALRQFEREAQVLGRLQHPSIAQILEAGTYTSHGEPRPFFAMELVDGLTLTEFARRHELDVPSRLKLFATVCDAVHHAHQMGVVHRDLKPANILVTANGVPKVLDFGVARTFDDEAGPHTAHTQVSEVVGTLPYISPEQISGDPLAVDTRTDVYALGVTLYELLVGRPPFDLGTASVAQALRIIELQPPPPLGSVDPHLSGDVEVITHKALEKEKDRRYASAAALADDIRRYLTFEPISARPPSTLYHLGRFARRHRALMFGLALTFAALVCGMAATTWQARRAHQAELLAVEQAARALAAERSATDQARRAEDAEAETRAKAETVEESNAFFQALIGFDSDDPVGATRAGSTTLRELTRSAGERLERTPFSDPETEATLRIAIGNAQRRFGDGASAVEVLQGALELREAVLGPDDNLVAETLNTLGVALASEGRTDEAFDDFERALEIYRANGSSQPEMEATTFGNLALMLIGQGELAKAETFLQHALEVHRAELGEDDLHLITDLDLLAYLRRVQRRDGEAEELLREAVAIARRTSMTGHLHALNAMGNLSSLLADEARFDEALELVRERAEASERALGADEETADAHSDWAGLALILDDPEQALVHAARAVELYEQVGPGSPEHLGALRFLGKAQQLTGNGAQGEATLQRAVDSYAAGPAGNSPEHLSCITDLGIYWCSQGDYDRGLAALRRAVEGFRPQSKTSGPQAVRAFDALARALASQEPGSAEAEDLHRSAVALAEALPLARDAGWLASTAGNYGNFLVRNGRWAEAVPLLRRAWQVAARRAPGYSADVDGLRDALANALLAEGDLDAVEVMFRDELAAPGARDRSERHLSLLWVLGTVLQEQGRTAEALEEGVVMQELAVQLSGPDSRAAAEVEEFLGAVLADAGEFDEAEVHFERGRAVPAARPPADPRSARLQAAYGQCLLVLGRHAEAEPLLLEALAALEHWFPDTHPFTRRALDAVAQLYESWGRPAEARAYRARLDHG